MLNRLRLPEKLFPVFIRKGTFLATAGMVVKQEQGARRTVFIRQYISIVPRLSSQEIPFAVRLVKQFVFVTLANAVIIVPVLKPDFVYPLPMTEFADFVDQQWIFYPTF
jgi:hypothetical protein